MKQKDVVLRVAGALSSGARPFIVMFKHSCVTFVRHIIDMKESTFVFASQCKRYCIDLQTQMLNFIVSRGVVSWLWCARVWLAGCERSTEGEAGEVWHARLMPFSAVTALDQMERTVRALLTAVRLDGSPGGLAVRMRCHGTAPSYGTVRSRCPALRVKDG